MGFEETEGMWYGCSLVGAKDMSAAFVETSFVSFVERLSLLKWVVAAVP